MFIFEFNEPAIAVIVETVKAEFGVDSKLRCRIIFPVLFSGVEDVNVMFVEEMFEFVVSVIQC